MFAARIPKDLVADTRSLPEQHSAADDEFRRLIASGCVVVAGPTPEVGYGTLYPADFTVKPHSHDCDQLLYGGSGMMTVTTDQGAWLLPPKRALWIPAGTVHTVRMIGPVATRSLFSVPNLAIRGSSRCEVIRITPLIHALLIAAYEARALPLDARKHLLLSLLLTELRGASSELLSLAFPVSKALSEKCQAYLTNPTPHETIEAWSDELGMSRRAFTRRFRRETGQSFATWRQQACLFVALPRLAAGETVTNVAFSLGYASSAAFTSMFRRVFGTTPRHYFAQHESNSVPPELTQDMSVGVSCPAPKGSTLKPRRHEATRHGGAAPNVHDIRKIRVR